MVIDNADGLSVRTDINAAITALVTCNSGTVEPATPYPGMLWLDLSVAPNGVLRQRDQSNSTWLPVLLPPEFRFAAADMWLGARTSPNRICINDKVDGSGTDILTLRDDGLFTLVPGPSGAPTSPNDIPTKNYVDSIIIPVGAVMHFAMNAAPTNWLKANGASLDRTAYSKLFAAIGTTYGSATGSTFNIPDLRGEFIRGFDDGRGLDAGRGFGSAQASDFASHTHPASSGTESAGHTHSFSDSSSSTSAGGSHAHTVDVNHNSGVWAIGGGGPPTANSNNSGTDIVYTTSTVGNHTHTVAVSGTTGGISANHTHAISVGAAGGTDTRPHNVAQLACIKYQ
jgi:microcystin-dependent protein